MRISGCGEQMDITIQSRTGIPTRRLRQILKTDSNRIFLSLLEQISDIEIESIIAIGPESCFLTIYIDTSLTHSTVENKCCLATIRKVGNFNLCPVPASAYKGQTAGTSGMLHRFFLSILGYRYFLHVVLPTERAVDGPIVGQSHVLPGRIVVRRIREIRIIIPREFPPFLKSAFHARLRRRR